MSRLLLVSSSSTADSGYLEHCEAQMRLLFSGADSVLFVPYALHDHDGYAATARERFGQLGLALDSVHEAEDPVRAVERAAAVFVGGGNTFRLLKTLYDRQLLEPLREWIRSGIPYMGTSAGSNLAGPSIRTTNDMPIVRPPSFRALGLVPFQINPHYIDPDPGSTHQGETRDTRLAEFHEENETPVVALREGAMLTVDGSTTILEGRTGAKLFRRNAPAVEIPPKTDLSELLSAHTG